MAKGSAPSEDGSNSLGMAFLAISSGSSDVIAFLVLGHVFASAMTGNTALLGIALSDGNLTAASQPASALLGFVAGAAFASIIHNPAASSARQTALVRTLLFCEASCLLAFAIVWETAGHPAGGGVGGAVHYLLILLCSFAMGIQGIAAKRINAPGVNTIVFTSTLVSIVLSVTEILFGRIDTPKIRSATKRQIAVFGAYAAGAMLAGLLYWVGFLFLVWMPAAAVVIALGLYEAQLTQSRK